MVDKVALCFIDAALIQANEENDVFWLETRTPALFLADSWQMLQSFGQQEGCLITESLASDP